MKKINLLILVLFTIGFCTDLDAQRKFHGKIQDIKEKREKINYTGAEVLQGEYQQSLHHWMYQQAQGTGSNNAENSEN